VFFALNDHPDECHPAKTPGPIPVKFQGQSMTFFVRRQQGDEWHKHQTGHQKNEKRVEGIR